MIKETNIIEFAKHKISGGIHPQEFKLLSNRKKITHLSLSKELHIPVPHHLKNKQLLISKGDPVSKGQPLLSLKNNFSATIVSQIHAPCDGFIEAITEQSIGHPSKLPQPVVIIKTSEQNEENIANHINPSSFDGWIKLNPESLVEKIHQAGIVGLGGAVFPTHIKLNTSINHVKTLIVNAMECEPYITCDDRLLREHSEKVLQGALISAKIVGAEEILFGIENNKPEAIDCLALAIENFQKHADSKLFNFKIKIIITKTKYPSGGEKQLIQLLTGKQVPRNHYPVSLGIIVQNVATIYAINDAITYGNSLTHRLVTVTGDLVEQAGNYWIAFGTPLSHIVSMLKIDPDQISNIILGGPLMGQNVSDLNIPTQKSTNCIIFNTSSSQHQQDKHLECIRCGECESACPVDLLPQQLYWFSKSEQWEAMENQHIFDCIECGACGYVCPSEIPLVSYYQFAKSEIKHLKAKQQQSDIAKMRFENRERRLTRIKLEREEKRRKTAEARKLAAQKKAQEKDTEADPEGKKSAIQAALERVQQKKENIQGKTNLE